MSRRFITIGHYIFNIQKINDVWYKKRLFCIFDKNLPYKLTIEYYEPHTIWEYNVVLKMPLPVDYSYVYHNFRIDTDEKCKKIINEINKKKSCI